jgi:valyl-tRNA synthetase
MQYAGNLTRFTRLSVTSHSQPLNNKKYQIPSNKLIVNETTGLHREATKVYRTYHNIDQAIKNLSIESFDDTYLNALSDEIVGYANCMSLQLLTHPLTYYAMI